MSFVPFIRVVVVVNSANVLVVKSNKDVIDLAEVVEVPSKTEEPFSKYISYEV